MEQSKVTEIFADAWHYDACPQALVGGSTDEYRELYWYGSKDVENSIVVVVVYTKSATNDMWLVSATGYAENYRLYWTYGRCTSIDLSPLMPKNQ